MLRALAVTALLAASPGVVADATQPWTRVQFNINCGLPPLPPLGCRVGACVCDQRGMQCQWTFICG